jgi:DNA-binding LacI/PurR family transcriptional regulator
MSRARASKRPSMADVARLAHVSSQTVSRYFTGVGYVREETRTRIAAAIEELGYVPNQSARNLRAQRTNTVGVLSMGPLNYGSSQVLTGLSLAAREADVTLMTSLLELDGRGHAGLHPLPGRSGRRDSSLDARSGHREDPRSP